MAQRTTLGSITVHATFTPLDANHHPLATDVRDFQPAQLSPSEPGRIHRQKHRVMKQIPGRGDQSSDLFRAQYDRQRLLVLRVRQILFHLATLQRLHIEKSKRGNMIDDGPNPELSFFQQVDLITPDIARFHVVEPFLKVPPKIFHRSQVGTHRALGVVAAHKLLAPLLHDSCHRELLYDRMYVPGTLTPKASAASTASF